MSQFLPVAGGATQVKQRLSAAAQDKNYQQNRNRNPQQPQKNVAGSGFFFCLIHHLHFFALLFSTFRISPRQCACAAEKNSKRKALTTVSNSFTHAGIRREANEIEFAAGELIDMPRTRSQTSQRTVLQPRPGDRRFVRRNKRGQFKEEVNVGHSLTADRRRKARTKVKARQGDRGDVSR